MLGVPHMMPKREVLIVRVDRAGCVDIPQYSETPKGYDGEEDWYRLLSKLLGEGWNIIETTNDVNADVTVRVLTRSRR